MREENTINQANKYLAQLLLSSDVITSGGLRNSGAEKVIISPQIIDIVLITSIVLEIVSYIPLKRASPK